MGPVPGQHVELLEGTFVDQVLDALAGGHLALGVVSLDRGRAPGVQGLFLAGGQVVEALGHGVLHEARGYRLRRDGPNWAPTGPSTGRGGPRAYSWTSSIRVPNEVLGWMKATVVPRDPGRGASSMTRPPSSFTAWRAAAQSFTR